MNTSFAIWACDPQRSLEERYGAECLIEQTQNDWRRRHGLPSGHDFETDRLRRKERSLNPAYEPQFSRTDAARAAEILGDLKQLSLGQYQEDRPLRNLACLQFCPALESLTIRGAEIRDWTPLPHLRQLRTLHIWEQIGRDFRPLAELTRLQELKLHLQAPWPDLTGLERLTELADLEFHGNVLALTAIPRLPAVRVARVALWINFSTPLRRVADLPEMPNLRRLRLENTCQLAGLERHPRLVNLEVHGFFEDLTPVAALSELTHLTLGGGDYATLAPIAQLPQLRRVVVRRETPQDFTPLADAPQLHEITVESCPVELADVGAINTLLVPWSEEFAVPTPRPLPPLRLLVRPVAEREQPPAAAPRDWGDDAGMAASEARWFVRELNRRLNALLGPDWGRVLDLSDHTPGSELVSITRREDIDRLREIAACLRDLLARTRYPWTLWLTVNTLHEYERSLAEISNDPEEFDADREREEWESLRERNRERREYLEREYRFRLQQEQGLPTRPEDFAPPPPAEDADAGVTVGGGFHEPPEYDLGTELCLYTTLTETTCYIREEDCGLAQLLLEIKAG